MKHLTDDPWDTLAEKFPVGTSVKGVISRLLERGVIGRAMPQGDILGLAPPLCLTREEADVIVRAARGALDAVFPSERRL